MGLFYSEPISGAERRRRYADWIKPCRKTTDEVIQHFQNKYTLEQMTGDDLANDRTADQITRNIRFSDYLPADKHVDLIGFFVKKMQKARFITWKQRKQA